MTSSSRLLLSIILAIFMHLLITPTIKAQLVDCTKRAEFCWNCSSIGVFTNTSNYKQNLDNLLSSFSSSATSNTYGFYNSSLGENSDKVNAIALCRGDVVLDACGSCLQEISTMILQNCPNQKEAILWGERCMVRYSNNSIFSIMTDSPIRLLPSPSYSTDAEQYKTVLDPLLNELGTKAAKGNSTTKFAYSNTTVSTSDEPIFALLQCTPDLSDKDCGSCLQNSISQIPDCCGGKIGARVLKPSCFVRYEIYPFYNATATEVLLLPRAEKGKSSSVTIIAIIVPIVIVAVVLFFVGFCFLRRKAKNRHGDVREVSVRREMTTTDLQFDLVTIEASTNNFSEDNKIGEGGFGAVYKGTLTNGQKIAVKRLSGNSVQGAQEFKNEVVLVAKLQHRNLVRLLGFCLQGEEKILIYEYVPNKSLDYFLLDHDKQRDLDWTRRYKIIEGIARAMLYLHEDSQLRIIHRDLKASNVLLDGEMNPKISDFGMARVFIVDQVQGNTSRIVGTYGYMSPEYAMHGQFSVKSDVFSFGVLVLEILSGKKNNGFYQLRGSGDLLSYAWEQWKNGTPLELLDPTLSPSFSRNEVMRCIHMGLLCVQENPEVRPTMTTIVLMLNSYSVTLPLPQQPALFHRHRTQPVTPTSQLDFDRSPNPYAPWSANDQSMITQIYPR